MRSCLIRSYQNIQFTIVVLLTWKNLLGSYPVVWMCFFEVHMVPKRENSGYTSFMGELFCQISCTLTCHWRWVRCSARRVVSGCFEFLQYHSQQLCVWNCHSAGKPGFHKTMIVFVMASSCEFLREHWHRFLRRRGSRGCNHRILMSWESPSHQQTCNWRQVVLGKAISDTGNHNIVWCTWQIS